MADEENKNEEEYKVDEQDLADDPIDSEERRRRVKEMLLRGIPKSHMAKFLNVERGTINRDERAIKEELRDKYKNFDITTGLGEVLEALDTIGRRAVMEAEATRSKRDKNSFLNTAIRAFLAKANVMTDAGAMPNAIGGLSRTVGKIDGADYESEVKKVIRNPESRRKLLSVVGQIIRTSESRTKMIKAKIIDSQPSTPTNGGVMKQPEAPEKSDAKTLSDDESLDW